MSLWLFNLYVEYIMWKAGLHEQAGIKITGRNINNLRYADDTTLMAESEEKLKNFLMRVKEESEKGGLKFNMKKTKIITSSPTISQQINGGKSKQWQILFSWALKSLQMVTAAMKFKKTLASWKESYDKPRQHIKKQRHHFADNGQIVKVMVFLAVMYGCVS